MQDKFRIDRVLHHGPIWENKFTEMVRGKVPISAISNKLGIHFNKVKKKASELGLDTKWTHLKGTELVSWNIESVREKYRDDWLILWRERPNSSQTELREIAGQVYMWLYRHDRLWLKENSPKIRRKNNVCLINWEQEDVVLLSEVKKVAKNWSRYEENRLIRKTKYGILKRLNKINYYNKHEKDLPKTKAWLISKTETLEHFQIRRAKSAICKLATSIIKEEI